MKCVSMIHTHIVCVHEEMTTISIDKDHWNVNIWSYNFTIECDHKKVGGGVSSDISYFAREYN